MRITVCLSGDAFFPLEVSSNTLISELKMLIEIESGISGVDFELSREGMVLYVHPSTNIEKAGIKDDDLLYAVPIPKSNTSEPKSGGSSSTIDFKSIKVPGSSGSGMLETIRKSLLSGATRKLAVLRERNPELAAVINDPVAFKRVFESQQTNAHLHREELERLMSADALNPAVQERIAELIKQNNIDMQMESALEYYPETFGQVSMLFINCKIKDQNIKAFVDSGAQSTIMSEDCARRCNLDLLIDKRWAGKAYGVGTQTIIGRVHNGLIEISGIFIPTSFIVLKDQSMDLLIGLDMLKRHQCCIDLKRNVLIIDGRIEAPFLPESEIPMSFSNPSILDDENADDRFDESQKLKIQALVDRGIARSRAIDELHRHQWDLDSALASHLQNMFGQLR
ncbi:Protein DDI1 isoform 1 [Schistosoma japonicum]|uniref:Protein DDI1 isoform 1 n=2 Tax=Schistosoma japonicum TaxID=6182 RepID=A0A4Z2CW58_SCHJA|nr:Protein DDI1 isoform 1 [Schistosoma japonicum]